MSEEAEDSSKKAIQEKLEDLSEMSLFEGEVKTEVDIESIVGGSIVHGTVDGIVLHEDGTATIRDWKSNVHDTFFDRYRRQIQFYAHALTQRGIDVREADIVDVGASSKKGEVVTYPIDTSPDAVEGLVDDMEQAIAQITSEHFPATPDPHTCSACDTSYICKYSEADQNSE
jgi:CRISPR/Cas system-associated exonuclease Cas4 (RecB family)